MGVKEGRLAERLEQALGRPMREHTRAERLVGLGGEGSPELSDPSRSASVSNE